MADIYERAWPVQDAKAAVVIIHGLAEHSGRYEHVAQTLNQAGYAVYAPDLRGHGRSVGFPGDMGGNVQHAVDDVASFCIRVAASHEKTFLLGHSLGTLFSISAMAEIPSGTVDGLILSGTALLPGPAVLESLGTGEGIPPEHLSRDPQVVEAYKSDELVFYDRIPPELTALAMEATQRAGTAIGSIAVPVLLVHGTDDAICDIQGADHVFVQCVVVDKTINRYKGLYHEVLNEPEKDEVLKDIVEWMDARLAGLRDAAGMPKTLG